MSALILALQMTLAAVSLPGTSAQTPSKTTREQADRLIQRIVGMLKSDDVAIQERAEKEIRRLSERDRSALLAVSSHEYWEREFAWSLLTRAGDRRVIPYLRQAVDPGDAKETLRLRAVEYLGKLNDAGSVGTFIRLARSGDDVAGAALRALGQIDDERARQALLECLEQPELPWHDKEDAMEAIGRQRDPRGVPAIIKIGSVHAPHDPPAFETKEYTDWVKAMSLKSVAAVALARIGTRESVEAAVRLIPEIEFRQSRDDTTRTVVNELSALEKRTKDPQFRDRLRALISQITPSAQREMSGAGPADPAGRR